jgi:hypothetical protein
MTGGPSKACLATVFFFFEMRSFFYETGNMCISTGDVIELLREYTDKDTKQQLKNQKRTQKQK